MTTSAVVFAHHNVGVRGLSALLANGVNVPLVVTHPDTPGHPVWYDSVAAAARSYGIPVRTPDDPTDPMFVEEVAQWRPDFLFAFGYPRLLSAAMLDLPPRGAFGLHGSLLPRHRGQSAVNWAIIRGERETGATFHHLSTEVDAGDIVGQMAVPILPDDTARQVADKVTVAAELVLCDALPALLGGDAPRRPQDTARGTWHQALRPEDGCIDWRQNHVTVHNLVRALAPPFGGAYSTIGGRKVTFHATRVVSSVWGRSNAPALYCIEGLCHAQCRDGSVLRVLGMEVDGVHYGEREFARMGTVSPTHFDPPGDELHVP